jgi:hypothetical protein
MDARRALKAAIGFAVGARKQPITLQALQVERSIIVHAVMRPSTENRDCQCWTWATETSEMTFPALRNVVCS